MTLAPEADYQIEEGMDPVDWALAEMKKMGTKQQFREWRRKLFQEIEVIESQGNLVTFKIVQGIIATLKREFGPKNIENITCTKIATLYKIREENLPFSGALEQEANEDDDCCDPKR